MIVASLLLILVAVAMLGLGLARGSNALLIGSIAASLLAAIALVVGARQAAADRVDEPELDEEPDPETDDEVISEVRQTEPVQVRVPDPVPAQAGPADIDDVDDEDPPDEPAPQHVAGADAARVARMGIEVLVIDGRPRYHLAGCVHLLGRSNEPLPVSEAVELGFTPCSLCEPDSALLAEARRV